MRLDKNITRIGNKTEQLPILWYLLKWTVIGAVAGALIGSASALLLASLNWATDYRENNLWIIALLPLGGLAIGLMYHYLAGTAARGNNFLIEEIRSSRNIIPFKMAPLVYIGTVLTHLFGGSAGREGTGVQMGGAIADFMSRLFKMHPYDRKIMIQIGIGAGFASIFGTPLAGAVFALEVIIVGRVRYDAILPVSSRLFCQSHLPRMENSPHSLLHKSDSGHKHTDITVSSCGKYSFRNSSNDLLTVHRDLGRPGKKIHIIPSVASFHRRYFHRTECLSVRNNQIYRSWCPYHSSIIQ